MEAKVGSDSTKNIVIVITRADRAGAQMHVRALLEAIRETHHLTVICGNHGFLTEESARLGCDVVVVESLQRRISLLADMRAIVQLGKVLRELEPDLVHAHSSKAGLVARVVCWRQRIPVIYTAHGWPFSPGNSWLKRAFSVRMERLAARLTSVIITVSRYDLTLAEDMRICAATDVRCIVNGVEDRFPAVRLAPNAPVFTIVSLARFAPQKNLACLVRALALVEADFRAIIAGDGPEFSMIKALVEQLGLQGKVELPGETEDPHALLQVADLFVLSSSWEGLPLAVIEAMSASLPIVATNVGGLEELVSNEDNGYLVGPDDHVQIATRIDRLAASQGQRTRMGRRSRQLYEEKFLLTRMISSTLDIYAEVSRSSM